MGVHNGSGELKETVVEYCNTHRYRIPSRVGFPLPVIYGREVRLSPDFPFISGSPVSPPLPSIPSVTEGWGKTHAHPLHDYY